jgi:hypothetical protein
MWTEYRRRTKRCIASLAIVGLLVAGVTLPVRAVTTDGHVNGSLRLSPGTAVSVAVAKAGLPISGRVVFKPEHGREMVIGVGKSGQFKVNLRAGTFTAFGGPPGWFSRCRANSSKPFKIVAGQTSKVLV